MYFTISENPNSPIVCNVPHMGAMIPEEFRRDYIVDDQVLAHEVAHLADNDTDELYKELLHFSSFIMSTISRVVVDIERFEREADEPMSAVGMGAFYTRTSTGAILRNIGPENRDRLEALYREYHHALTNLTRGALTRHDRALIVDCHSFPSIPRPYESNQTTPRPDICIGFDSYHTPDALRDILQHNFRALGYTVGINTPFSGAIVPMEYYQKDNRVVSVMIEVNRKLYMDEATFRKSEHFSRIGKDISRCIIKSLNQFLPTRFAPRSECPAGQVHA